MTRLHGKVNSAEYENDFCGTLPILPGFWSDLECLANWRRKHNLILNVDNCFATPLFTKPGKWGAHLVHFIPLLNLLTDKAAWSAGLCWNKELIKEVRFFARHTGPSMAPFNAWVLSKVWRHWQYAWRNTVPMPWSWHNGLKNQVKWGTWIPIPSVTSSVCFGKKTNAFGWRCSHLWNQRRHWPRKEIFECIEDAFSLCQSWRHTKYCHPSGIHYHSNWLMLSARPWVLPRASFAFPSDLRPWKM